MSHTDVPASLQTLLGAVMVLYVVLMFVLGFFAQGQVKDTEDYIVAGRRLPLSLAWCTLMATWFGAATILTSSTEVARDGLRKAALDPLGAGFCLIIAGFFFAKPLWSMGLLTVCDFFRRRFGPGAEVLSALIMIPSYFGWISAQFVALAHVLHLFFGMPLEWGIFIVALVGTGYTLLGGMWAITLTDAVQIVLILGGLVVLTFSALGSIGHGDALAGYNQVMNAVQTEAPQKLIWIPHDTAAELFGWVSVFLAGALGNLPGQDLMQRVFASKSAEVAQRACWLSGCAYIAFGMFPLVLGLIAASYFRDKITDSVLPALANAFMHPALAVIFVVVLVSAVLATVTSAILSPSTVLAQNLLLKLKFIKLSGLAVNRICVVVVALLSLAMAYSGEGAYQLVENSYSLTMVGLFVPLVMGLYTHPRTQTPAIVSILVGVLLWLPQYLMRWECFLETVPPFDVLQLPLSLTATFLALFVYLAIHLSQLKLPVPHETSPAE